YKLETWEHENRIVLVKNPDYYDARNVQIDRIEGAMILEASTEMALYEAGDLDCTCGWGIPFEDIGRVKAHPTLSQEFYSAPRLITYYYGFNVTKAPFDNALVRKAFSAAIDRQGLIDNVLKGGQKVALTFTAPGNFGAVDAQAEGIGIPFDSGRARQYLVDAGYPGGQGLPPITLMYNTSEGHKKIAEAIQAMWREHLGVEVSLANQEFAVYLDTLVSDAPQVWRLGWLADYPDANNWVEVFISTSGNNFGKYNNPEYDQLVADAAREQDPERRLELYKQAERLLAETDAAIAPIYHYTFVTLSKPYLTRTYEPFGNKVFKHWRIER
ncbi:MAG: peptide ABC transporter substrate-binding protein, partial [Dehalococcoidia bacterium]